MNRGSGVLAWSGAGVLDVLAWVGEHEISRFGCSAASAWGADVGDEHGRERGALVNREARGLSWGIDAERSDGLSFSVAFLGAAGDGDGGAVHVHLAVADLVEPGPGEGVLARGNALGD